MTRMGAHQGVWHCFAPSSMSHSRPILTLHRCQAVGVILLRVPSSSRIAAMAKPGGWGRRALQEGAIGSGLSGRYRHPRTSRNGVDHGDRASLPRHQMAHGHRAVDSALPPAWLTMPAVPSHVASFLSCSVSSGGTLSVRSSAPHMIWHRFSILAVRSWPRRRCRQGDGWPPTRGDHLHRGRVLLCLAR